MGIKFANNASSTLKVGISAVATSMTVDTGDGALFPAAGGSDWFYCTLIIAATNTREIVKVTSRTGDVFTITRAQEGTTGTVFSTGDLVRLQLTAAALNEFAHVAANNTWTGTQTFRDNKFEITDDGDTTKKLAFQCSGITTGTTRTATWPNQDGTVALTDSLGMRNKIINGDMRIAQRGTSATTQGYSTVDRWYINRSDSVSGLTMTQVYGAFGTVRHCLGLHRDAGNTSTATLNMYQAIEGMNCRDLAGNNVTVSFLVGAGGNVTATGHSVSLYYQTTTTDIGPAGSWTLVSSSSFTVTASSSFTQKTATFAVPSNATQLKLVITFAVSGTAGADDRFYITGVQLEAGSTATPFESRPYGTELALCQRYFQFAGSGANGSFDSSTTFIQITEKCVVPMRTAPTGSIVSGVTAAFRSMGSDFTAASPALANFSTVGGTSFWTQVSGFTGGTSNAVVTARNQITTNGGNFIALSAEL